MIANKFAEVSMEYDKLKDDDIKIPEYTASEIPQFTEYDVQVAFEEMDAIFQPKYSNKFQNILLDLSQM